MVQKNIYNIAKKIILCNQSLLFQIKEIAWTTISGDSANDSCVCVCVCVSLVNLYMAIKWFTNDLNNIMDKIYEQILLNISKALSRLYVQCETKVSKCDGRCVTDCEETRSYRWQVHFERSIRKTIFGHQSNIIRMCRFIR